MPPAIITASIEATLIGVCSNLTAQVIDAHRKARPFSFSAMDFARFILYTAMTAPPNFYWQVWLERMLPARPSPSSPRGAYQTEEQIGLESETRADATATTTVVRRDLARNGISWRNTFGKWFLDCITLGTLWNIAAFLLIIGLLKGHSTAQVVETVRTETFPLILTGYKIWPFASVINFTLIPVEKRIVFLSAVGYTWDVYLSLVASSK
ncbi:hypothetical protein K431DRAFT_214169 [Polychaeton citri CBS 116435]|uniref:Uncharacterized protein n=1 Tax=Polychaeton citri CBS 116435 TaxID=1314669 RepID=A0A9P4QFC5_9PEZI|nr:hypothetical protein K431DRAFT_214169 [Polychaeton citri CBS 116435]